MRSVTVITVLAAFYLLASVRYFPGQPLETLLATLGHMLQSLPLLAAVTYLVVLVVRKVAGQVPSLFGIARIFLLIALGYEFLFALHHYTTVAGGP
ncbi:inner-membrane translocator [Desulfurivibrio alkaliphilus]|nr:inner-membrane translocator [Desulfurivibrio alkaliphilus]